MLANEQLLAQESKGPAGRKRSAPMYHAIDILELWSDLWCVGSSQLQQIASHPAAKLYSLISPAPLSRRFGSGAAEQLQRSPSLGHAFRPRRAVAPRRAPQADATNRPPGLNAAAGGSTSSPNLQEQLVAESLLQRTPSLPCATPDSAAHQRQAAIIQELPGIGTWAGRQRLFARPQPHPLGLSLVDAVPPQLKEVSGQLDVEPVGRGPSSDQIAGGSPKFNAPAVPNGYHQNGYEPNGVAHDGYLHGEANGNGEARVSDSSEVLHEAWRWRFSRKWEAEQRRALDVDPTAGGGGDPEMDALAYCQACGVGVDLQVTENPKKSTSRQRSKNIDAPPGSRGSPGSDGDRDGGPLVNFPSASTSTMQFEVDPSFTSAGGLAAEGSGSFSAGFETLAKAAPSPIGAAATREVLSMVGRGRQLLQRQLEIETAASELWEQSCAGSPWAGTYLAPVAIDMFGRFTYVIVRVMEPGGGRQRFLLRGRMSNSASELLAAVGAEAAAVTAEHAVPLPVVEVVGSGVMEWRSDTERHLILSPAPVTALAALNGNAPGARKGFGSPPKKPS